MQIIQNLINDAQLLYDFVERLSMKGWEVPTVRYDLLAGWTDIDRIVKASSDFEKNTHQVIEKAKFIDKQLWESIYTVLEESILRDAISDIYTQLRVTQRKMKKEGQLDGIKDFIIGLRWPALGVWTSGKRKNNSDGFTTTPTKKTLSTLHRLLSLLDLLKKAEDEFEDDDDDDVIDKNLLLKLFNTALSELEVGGQLNPQARVSIDYINEAKFELGKETPSWKKIIGAVSVAATITAGIAVYPEAEKNLNDALNYLMESVESISILQYGEDQGITKSSSGTVLPTVPSGLPAP